jgi:predicted nucleic acid-binding protein
VRFWDASAVVPLLLAEPVSAGCRALYRDDPHLLVWWGTELECASAISRREREEAIDARMAQRAFGALDELRSRWDEVQPVDSVRDRARRLVRVHPLRTADGLQLAAAIVVAEGVPASLPFVCLDQRLADAAARDGFPIVGP